MRFHLAVTPLLLAACAATAPLPDTAAVDALLLGEQHDASAHPRLQEQWITTLAQRGRLAALALEMAERGTSTAGLPAGASEEEVRRALRWNQDSGWPWERYGPAIMAAVRAGVPVFGANLARSDMRAAMQDEAIDRLLPAPAVQAQQQAIRSGHCDMLPERQVQPMTRVQIARDAAMARAVADALRPGKTVVLIAGSGHVKADIGVPRHLPAHVSVRPLVLPEESTGRDYCAEFRRQAPRAS
jgi:uncharacterized iron-regulated protein